MKKPYNPEDYIDEVAIDETLEQPDAHERLRMHQEAAQRALEKTKHVKGEPPGDQPKGT